MLLCIPITGPDLESVKTQLAQASNIGGMVEFRVDLFDQIPIAELVALKHQYSLPVLVTLRSSKQGGRFVGDEAACATYLRHLCELQPELLDIELGMPRSEVLDLKRLLPHSNLVISHHDLTHTPKELEELLHRMQQLPAHYYKIASTAQSTNDALRMLAFTRAINRLGGRLCGICMGPLGTITRILAPLADSPITFASLDATHETAPGQIAATTLRDIYRLPRHNGLTYPLGLIGNPVDSSRGYLVHNAVFDQLGLPAVFVKMPVLESELAQFFELTKAFGWKGFAVTMPLKESVMSHLDAIDPAAKQIGAVNTIVREDNRFVGYNVDGLGALDAIEAKLPQGVYDQRVVVLGAGGAAKAIIHEAKTRGAHVTIVNRSIARAEVLAEQFGVHAKPIERLPDLLQSAPAVLIQSTAVGMHPREDDTLVNAEYLHPQTLVFDVIAVPTMTRLLRDAQAKGCITVSGVEMWLGLAQRQLLLWFPNLSTETIGKAVSHARHFMDDPL